MPSLLSGILVMFLPESPKFLMSRGRNEEAIKVFKTLYRVNNGSSTEYPVSKFPLFSCHLHLVTEIEFNFPILMKIWEGNFIGNQWSHDLNFFNFLPDTLMLL